MTPPSTTPELQLELPVRPESVTAARHAVGEIGFQLGCDAVAVRIAVSEAVGNAVVHAYREEDATGPILVLGRVLRRRLIVTVADRGCGMTPHLESDGLGIGLPVISKVCLDVRIESDRSGTAIAMSFAVASTYAGDVAAVDDQAAAAASDVELERARQLVRSLGGKAHLRGHGGRIRSGRPEHAGNRPL
jgi:anti-sigma regulatory factor (Ser/Thr protein kinase)